MKGNSSLTFYKNSCITGVAKSLSSIAGVLSGMFTALFILLLLHESDDFKIGKGEMHPFSLLAAVISAILIKNIVYKLCCSRQSPNTTAILPHVDCTDKTRSLLVRYIIPSAIGVLFGYLLSLILTAFMPDDEDILNHSSHLISSGIAAGTTTVLNDMCECCCIKGCLKCEDTRPNRTVTESDYLSYPPINSV